MQLGQHSAVATQSYIIKRVQKAEQSAAVVYSCVVGSLVKAVSELNIDSYTFLSSKAYSCNRAGRASFFGRLADSLRLCLRGIPW